MCHTPEDTGYVWANTGQPQPVAWGSEDPDIDGDGTVGADDLLAVMDGWGPCP